MNWTIRSILKTTIDYLTLKKIDSPRTNAEWLLIECLGYQNRIDLYLDYDKILVKNEVDHYRSLIQQRLQHRPLQYLIGHTQFFSYRIEVNEHVLIPRPETELLVEKVAAIAKPIVKEGMPYTILDIGTGSGAVAISLTKILKTSHCAGVDISAEALNVALRNIRVHHCESQIQLAQGDLCSAFKPRQFNLIIANLPYVASDEWNNLPDDVRNFEPRQALVAPEQGTFFIKEMIHTGYQWLKPEGLIALEIGEHQQYILEAAVQETIVAYKAYRFETDLCGKVRFLFLFT